MLVVNETSNSAKAIRFPIRVSQYLKRSGFVQSSEQLGSTYSSKRQTIVNRLMVGSQLLCAKSKGGLIFYRARYIEHSSSTRAILFIKKYFQPSEDKSYVAQNFVYISNQFLAI